MKHREQYYEQHTNRVASGHANMESNLGYAPLGQEETPRLDGRVNLTVISYIHRDRDPDATAIKYLIDSLVSCGVLANDTSKEIGEITQRQVKVKNKTEEKTEVILVQDTPKHGHISAPNDREHKVMGKAYTDRACCTNCSWKHSQVCKQCEYKEDK